MVDGGFMERQVTKGRGWERIVSLVNCLANNHCSWSTREPTPVAEAGCWFYQGDLQVEPCSISAHGFDGDWRLALKKYNAGAVSAPDSASHACATSCDFVIYKQLLKTDGVFAPFSQPRHMNPDPPLDSEHLERWRTSDGSDESRIFTATHVADVW